MSCGVIYLFTFQLNMHWFGDWLEFSSGVNWVFIPSGLRLLFVLVLAETGAAGIVLGTLVISYTSHHPDTHLFNTVTSFISGAAPYLARHLCITRLHLDAHLSNLNAQAFFKISIVFAIVNALMHQIWFFWTGATENFTSSTTAMAVGDWLGTVLVLTASSVVLKTFKRLNPPNL